MDLLLDQASAQRITTGVRLAENVLRLWVVMAATTRNSFLSSSLLVLSFVPFLIRLVLSYRPSFLGSLNKFSRCYPTFFLIPPLS